MDHSTVGAAKSRHISNKTKSKLIVKVSEVSADDCLRCCRPRETYTRRKVSLRHKFRVVVPTHTKIQSEFWMKLPIVLKKQCVVVVAQVDLVSLRRQTTGSCDGKESGVDWSKRDEVGNSGEKLQV